MKKLLNDQEYLNDFTEKIFDRIRDFVVVLYTNEEDENKNAPIRDMTIKENHLRTLDKTIMSKIPNIEL